MKKRLLCLLLGLSSFVFAMQAQNGFDIIDSIPTRGTAISDNGKYVTGFVTEGISFIWDVETPEFNLITRGETDMDLLTATGIATTQRVSGFFRDPSITFIEQEYGETISPYSAAVWNGNELVKLGLADIQEEDLRFLTDGSYTTCISADGNTIGGYTRLSSNYTPYIWRYSSATNTWTHYALELPEGATQGQVLDMSSDGDYIVGFIVQNGLTKPAFWIETDFVMIIGEDELDADFEGVASKIRFTQSSIRIAFTIENGIKSKGGVYNLFENVEIIEGLEDTGYFVFGGIAEDGTVFGTYESGNDFEGYRSRSFFYNTDYGVVDFDYFVRNFAPDAVLPADVSFSYQDDIYHNIASISADGKVIMGTFGERYGKFQNNPKVWKLTRTEEINVVIFNIPQNLTARIVDMNKVALAWEAPEEDGENTLTGYNIYRDGELIASNLSPETLTHLDENLEQGYHHYTISALYDDSKESQRTQNVEVVVVDSYALPFFDGFESESIATNYWQVIGNSDGTNNAKGHWGTMVLQGLVGNYGLSHYSFAPVSAEEHESYDNSLLSRPMDANGLENIYLTYAWRVLLYTQREGFPEITDTLDIDLGINDEWTNLKRYQPTAMAATPYVIEAIDIKELVGNNVFQIRMRAYGEGHSSMQWVLDNIRVDYEKADAPDDMMTAVKNSDEVKVVWKNSSEGYELTYLNNYMIRNDVIYAAGNDGEPFIAVIGFNAEELISYNGKYLRSITLPMYTNFPSELQMDLVIYAENELVYNQRITGFNASVSNTFLLDEPFLIENIRDLKFGVKVLAHNIEDNVVPYQLASSVPNKSDLISYDDGQTWESTSLNTQNPIVLNWYFIGNVTDSPSEGTEIQDNVLIYTIFKNGEKYVDNLFYYPFFVDTDYSEGDCYQVMSYYRDGSISELSESFCPVDLPTGLTPDKNADVIRIYPNPAASVIHIEGELNKAVLYDLNGKAVMETLTNQMNVRNVADGIYLMRIESNEGNSHQKVIIRK